MPKGKGRTKRAAESNAGAKAATPEKPVRKVLRTLTDRERSMIDPQVRRVAAMRMQVQEEGQRVDTMLSLVFPSFERGDVLYDPATGEFFQPLAGKSQPKPQDPTEAPVSGPKLVKGGGRKNA